MTLQSVLAYVLPVLGWWLLTGILNLAFGYRSQIEAWVTARPRLAALLKLSRALGFDPWNGFAALLLIAKKKLPDAQRADSPIAKVEQRKADLKRLGGSEPPDDGAAGGGTERMFPPPSERPPEPPTAAMFGLAFVLLALVVLTGCDPRKPPCDEDRLRAIDAAYVAETMAHCGSYATKEECPDWPSLRDKHRVALRQECPQ